jgi:hypothetical protein
MGSLLEAKPDVDRDNAERESMRMDKLVRHICSKHTEGIG